MDFEDSLQKHNQYIEELGGYFAVQKRLAFSKLFFSISLRANREKEHVELNFKTHIGERAVCFDIYLPEGIEKLKIPANSVVEFKYSILSDTLHRVNILAQKYKEDYPNAMYYLIYKDPNDIRHTIINKTKQKGYVYPCQLDDFIKRIDRTRKITEAVEQEEKDWRSSREQIIDSASVAFRENNCSLFLGAGVSQDAGGPSWNTLLEKSVRKLRKPFTKKDFKKIYNACGMSPIILGRYLIGGKTQKKILSSYLHDYVLYKDVNPIDSKLIGVICDMVETNCVESIITYNYDDLVETSLKNRGIAVGSIESKSRNHKNELPVYHVHGLIPQDETGIESTPVLSEEDYHKIYKESYHWSNVEQLHALDRNTCFLIGLSLTDPNLRRLLEFSHNGNDGEIYHYAFLKREPLYADDKKHEKNIKHFSIIEAQLESLGVAIIWYEDYKEIPDFLKRISSPLKFIF